MMKVLVVDDNENNRLTLNLLLEEIEGIHIFEAEDGKVAADLCLKHAFDLVFMDIMMPRMDGFEATQYIKKMQPNCMVIALSALDDEASKHKMLSLGAEDYLTKPLNAELFNVRIRQYLRILELRSLPPKEVVSVNNPFTKHVYSHTLTFRVECEEDLAQFWDYWLVGEKNILNLSDCVRLTYGFGLWLLKKGETFSIVVEENGENLYMMLLHVKMIGHGVIKNILLKHFQNAKYILQNDMLCFALDKEICAYEKPSFMSDEVKEVLTKTHINILGASDYLESTAISFLPKIDTLEMINDEIDHSIVMFEKTPSHKNMSMVCDNFQEYVDVLEQLVDFAHLGFALKTLVEFLGTLSEEDFEEAKVHKLSSMLLNLLHDLNAWRENVFITQVARDIHYLDASLLSSCIQIEGIFEQVSVEAARDDEIEFF